MGDVSDWLPALEPRGSVQVKGLSAEQEIYAVLT